MLGSLALELLGQGTVCCLELLQLGAASQVAALLLVDLGLDVPQLCLERVVLGQSTLHLLQTLLVLHLQLAVDLPPLDLLQLDLNGLYSTLCLRMNSFSLSTSLLRASS